MKEKRRKWEELGGPQAQFSTLPGVCAPLPPADSRSPSPSSRAGSTLCPQSPPPLGYIVITRTLFPIILPGETQARKTGAPP